MLWYLFTTDEKNNPIFCEPHVACRLVLFGLHSFFKLKTFFFTSEKTLKNTDVCFIFLFFIYFIFFNLKTLKEEASIPLINSGPWLVVAAPQKEQGLSILHSFVFPAWPLEAC